MLIYMSGFSAIQIKSSLLYVFVLLNCVIVEASKSKRFQQKTTDKKSFFERKYLIVFSYFNRTHLNFWIDAKISHFMTSLKAF